MLGMTAVRALALCLSLSWAGVCCSPAPEPFAAGDQLPEFKLSGTTFEGDSREIVLARDRWWLVLYYGRDDASAFSRAEHLEKLLRKFADQRVGSVGLIDPEGFTLLSHLRDYRLSYPLVIDSRRSSAAQLRHFSRQDRLWLIDPNGNIEFTASGKTIRDDDLRQLLEKHLLDRVSRHDTGKAKLLASGSLFPGTRLSQMGTDQVWSARTLAEAGFNRYVVFTADCAACNLYSYLMRFRAAYTALGGNGRRVAAVFTSRFSSAEVGEAADEIGLNAPLFVAQEEIRGIEDSYFLRSLIAPVVVVDTGRGGIVQLVRSFDEVWHEAQASRPKRPPEP